MEPSYENIFKQWFDDNHKRVFNICLNMVQQAEDAEDITQEVFIEVYRSMSAFDHRSSVATWIYRIAVNKSLDHIKARHRKKRYALFTRLFHPETGEVDANALHFEHPGVILENKERSAILFNTLNRLPEKQRTAFVLSRLERFSHKEIAQIMHITEKASEMLVKRAKDNLKQILGNIYEQRGI